MGRADRAITEVELTVALTGDDDGAIREGVQVLESLRTFVAEARRPSRGAIVVGAREEATCRHISHRIEFHDEDVDAAGGGSDDPVEVVVAGVRGLDPTRAATMPVLVVAATVGEPPSPPTPGRSTLLPQATRAARVRPGGERRGTVTGRVRAMSVPDMRC